MFTRLLALIYLIAFASLAAQLTGLVGEHGILPVGDFLRRAHEAYGTDAYHLFPTLLWLSPTDAFLNVLCWSGIATSVLLLFGIVPIASALALWVLYLSLTVAGQVFLQFQWDALLLESGLLAVLYAPPVWRSRLRTDPAPPAVVRWVLYGLAFKVTFLSGLTKLLSGDPTWANLMALQYHYETQPLPMWTSWFMYQLPAAFHVGSAAGMFVIELIAPWTAFLPTRFRRTRLAGCVLMIALQLGIAATGNYGFFNLLTIVLYLALLEDSAGPPRMTALPGGTRPTQILDRGPARWRLVANGAAVVIAVLSVMTVFREIDVTSGRTSMIERLWSPRLLTWIDPLNSVNGYGLFRVMTTERPEIVIEVSDDGALWKEQEFRWKPGDVKRRPAIVQPHMPRLDWQMWFAALDPVSAQQWLRPLLEHLFAGDRVVTRLLGPNPLNSTPRFARLAYYQYHFTSRQEGERTGTWWKRQFVGYLTDVVRRPD